MKTKAKGEEVISEQLPRRHVTRFREGLVFKAHGLFASLSSRLEGDHEEEKAEAITRR